VAHHRHSSIHCVPNLLQLVTAFAHCPVYLLDLLLWRLEEPEVTAAFSCFLQQLKIIRDATHATLLFPLPISSGCSNFEMSKYGAFILGNPYTFHEQLRKDGKDPH